MVAANTNPLADTLARVALPMEGAPSDLEPIMDLVGGARFVLIGEASHGTHEFYRTRADITHRLIDERGFNAVAVEADWPDAWRVNRFVRGFDDDDTAEGALEGFERFPQWMWRNADVLDFVGWLRERNDAQKSDKSKAGFYGIDLYSLYGSIRAVLAYLDKVDPDAARRARYRYSCFDHAGEDPQAYGYAASFNLGEKCEREAVEQLIELQKKAGEYRRRDDRTGDDEHFFAEQNAKLVLDAERYYRGMFQGRINTWNLRDTHMAETIDALADYLAGRAGQGKVVVWAHNSHLGDARATEMGERGELNVGQLVRESHPGQCVNVGFSTYAGTVTAASDWDGPAERKRVRPGMPGSCEALLHDVSAAAMEPKFMLDLSGATEEVAGLREPRLQRAIGVIYRPETERISHYFHARLADQFDMMIHVDQTRAVEPLERVAPKPREELPETFPSGV